MRASRSTRGISCRRATYSSTSAFDGIAQQISQASDILKDGTNVPGKPCDGISIGLGFVGKKIANPTKIAADDAAVPPDPCSTDGGGSDSSTDGATDVADGG